MELVHGAIDTAEVGKRYVYVGLNRSLRTMLDTGEGLMGNPMRRVFESGYFKHRPDAFAVYMQDSKLYVELTEVLSESNKRAEVAAALAGLRQQILNAGIGVAEVFTKIEEL